jgi:hypothetical protein
VAESNWTRPRPRAPRPYVPSKRNVLSIFWGTPDEVVARWCGVSLSTVRSYKTGKRKPSPAVVRLFMLHRERRVLGSEWKGWLVKPGSIVDPDGNETSRSQLSNYFWIVQLSRRIVYDRDDPRLHAEFEKLLDMG